MKNEALKASWLYSTPKEAHTNLETQGMEKTKRIKNYKKIENNAEQSPY